MVMFPVSWLSPITNLYFVVGVVLSVEAIIVPTIRSILSKLVTREEQGMSVRHDSVVSHAPLPAGALFAFVSSMEAVGIAMGSAVYGNLYPTLFQRSYFLMAFLYLTPVLPLRLVIKLLLHN